jgi:hypothetical protein
VENPKTYFKGTLPMRWGPIARSKVEGFVYFGVETNNIILGLGGGKQYMIGEIGESTETSDACYLISQILQSELDKSGPDNTPNQETTLHAIRDLTKEMLGLQQHLEFMAKTIRKGRLGSEHILLGSPIYVALAD